MRGNQTKFAEYLGVSEKSISIAVKEGRIKKDDDGLIDFEQGVKDWHGSKAGLTVKTEQETRRRGREVRKPTGEDDTLPEEMGDDSGRLKYRAAIVFYENQLAKLQIAIRDQVRVYTEAAESEASGLGATLRGALERLADISSPRLTGTSAHEEIIAVEIESMKKAIAGDIRDGIKRIKNANAS